LTHFEKVATVFDSNGIGNLSSLCYSSDVTKFYTIDEMRCFEKDTVVHKYLEDRTTSLDSLYSDIDNINEVTNAHSKTFLDRIEKAKGGGRENEASKKIAEELELDQEYNRLRIVKADFDNKIRDETNIFNKLLEEALTSYFKICRQDRTPAETLLSISGILILYHFRKKLCRDSMELEEGEVGKFDSFLETISNIYGSLGDNSQKSLSTLFGGGLELKVFESYSNRILSLTLT